MAGIQSLFRWDTKEEREKEKADYEKRIYPLGQTQKDMDRAILQAVIQTKSADQERMFLLCSVRDWHLEYEEDMQTLMKANRKSKTWRIVNHISEQDKACIIVLAVRGLHTPLESYPDAESILAQAQELLK